VPQPPCNLGIVGHRQLEQLGHLVPVAQHELDVVVALRQQDRLLVALRGRA
jgi:hypothetical protein